MQFVSRVLTIFSFCCMDSLFSKESPFTEDAKKKAFYIPSKSTEQSLEDVSSVINNKRQSPVQDFDAKFTRSSGIILKDQVPTPDQCNFDESSGSSKYDETWPSTDQTLAEVPEDQMTPKAGGISHRTKNTSRQSNIQSGTLAKYIEKFRKDPPRKRDNRTGDAKRDEPPEFWWLSPPSSSSTPTTDADVKQKKSIGISTPVTSHNKMHLSPKILPRKNKDQNTSLARNLLNDSDIEIESLQVKADKLIELSESTLTSTSSPDDSNHANKEISKPIFPRSSVRETLEQHNLPSRESQSRPINPEEDILYQWRLARKISQARESATSNVALWSGKAENQSIIAYNRRLVEIPVSSVDLDLATSNADQGKGEPVASRNNENKHKLESSITMTKTDAQSTLLKSSSTQTNKSPRMANCPSQRCHTVHHNYRTSCSCNQGSPLPVNNLGSAIPVLLVNTNSSVAASSNVRQEQEVPYSSRESGKQNSRRNIPKSNTASVGTVEKSRAKHSATNERQRSCRNHQSQRPKTEKPTKPNVTNTIAQSVTEHLFSTPVESDQETTASGHSVWDNSVEESSEEEFPDDEFLQSLRHKRREYLKRLRQLKDLYLQSE